MPKTAPDAVLDTRVPFMDSGGWTRTSDFRVMRETRSIPDL